MQARFRLTRWFALLGLLAIVIVGAICAALLSRFLAADILKRDAVVSMEFVQGVVQAQRAQGYFTGERPPDRQLVEFFDHIALMPAVLRANVFSRDRMIIWSSDPALNGRRFDGNPQLDSALDGRLEISVEARGSKNEHVFLRNHPGGFVEFYLPVRGDAGVIGVVEVYKAPQAIFESIDRGVRLVWTSAAAGGLFLYLVLFWTVRRADRIIAAQQARLVENETLAALGAMASAVAHGIRNPLASIRSSAELNLDNHVPAVRESSEDIVVEVDRLERWVRDLLTYSAPEAGEPENVRVGDVLHDSLNRFDAVFDRRGIRVSWRESEHAALVKADHALLSQVFSSLLTNAMEAMPTGGEIEISTRRCGADRLQVDIRDTGSGVDPDFANRVFVPRQTTKRSGLGVGLPLARRIVERFGGRLDLLPGDGAGVIARVELQVVR